MYPKSPPSLIPPSLSVPFFIRSHPFHPPLKPPPLAELHSACPPGSLWYYSPPSLSRLAPDFSPLGSSPGFRSTRHSFVYTVRFVSFECFHLSGRTPSRLPLSCRVPRRVRLQKL
ncbi:hypothetical protein BU16DRAFT_319576 [Lophium mytilinum]|uniref:Uncharacterized protein n=1 Tax=Lophium mytilinum TaxID=390894 RepID=A0A6A6QYS3_9PEZI|nr:hypothetical protein BU16DRAFT_319576 [Lophium mytilinum]